MKPLNPIVISGCEMLPLVEGGKGISISNGESSGAWAASGAVGTFSGVNADSYNEAGELIPQLYFGRTRRERHEELVAYAIAGGHQETTHKHEREQTERALDRKRVGYSATGSEVSSTRTRGLPAGITASPTARTRSSRSRPCRGCANCAT